MSGKSIISVPTIIACIVVYNLFFGDDDEDKKNVEVVVDEKPAVVEVTVPNEIADKIKYEDYVVASCMNDSDKFVDLIVEKVKSA